MKAKRSDHKMFVHSTSYTETKRCELEKRIAHGRERIHQLAREYEAAVAEQSKHIIKLQRTLNSLTPAGSLPPELLVKIFSFCAPSPALELYRVPDPYRWIHLTHVCHYWRMIGLTSVELWTFVAPHHAEHASELLKRSKEMLIKVQARCDQSAHLSYLPILLRQLPRMEALSVLANYRAHQLAIPPTFAPHLKTITLVASKGSEPLPRFLYNISTTSLRNLVLCGWEFSWKCSIFRPTITRLAVSAGNQRRLSAFSSPNVWERMFEALESLPLLESLDIKNLLPPTLTSANRQIILPNVSSLHLTDTVCSCIFFLDRVSCSERLALSLDFGTETPSGNLEELASLLANRLAYGGIPQRQLRSLSISLSDTSKITLRAMSERLDARELADPIYEPRLRIMMNLSPADHIPQFLQSFSHTFLGGVESCCIRIFPSTPDIRDALAAFSDELPNLTQLAVCGTDSAVLLPGMLLPSILHSDSPTSSDDSLPLRIPFPRLTTLALVDVNFEKLKPEDKLIESALWERRNQYHALHKIQLVNAWDIDPDQRQKLTQLLVSS